MTTPRKLKVTISLILLCAFLTTLGCAKTLIGSNPREPSHTAIPIPAQKYAESLGLNSYLELIKEMDQDGEMDENEKLAIDTAYKIAQLFNISEEARRKNISYILSSRNPDSVNAYDHLSSTSKKALEENLEFGLNDSVVKYVLLVSSLTDETFSRYALENKLCIQDGVLTGLEMQFLNEPEKYSKQLLDVYKAEGIKIGEEIARELLNLSDFEVADAKRLEAWEDIFWELASKPEYRRILDRLVSSKAEGVKQWTAGEALTWLAYEKDFTKKYLHPLENFNPENLFRMAWMDTAESNKYQSVRWQNFDEVTNRLNSPLLLVVYMRDNFTYDVDKYKRWIAGDHRWDFALDIFKKKRSDCGGQAIFALHCLLQNGCLYNDFDANKNNAACLLGCWDPSNTDKGSHTVLLYIKDGSFYTIDSGFTTSMKGPFTTIEKAADATLRG